MEAFGSEQPTVAMVTKQDQFLTLSRESFKSAISPDGQPDDLKKHKHILLHVSCQLRQKTSESFILIHIVF